jgi:hypothetical protein
MIREWMPEARKLKKESAMVTLFPGSMGIRFEKKRPGSNINMGK